MLVAALEGGQVMMHPFVLGELACGNLANRSEVLELLARAKTNNQIARELFIGEATVKSHVHSILSKLNVSSRTQAALYAVNVGLVPADELGEESR